MLKLVGVWPVTWFVAPGFCEVGLVARLRSYFLSLPNHGLYNGQSDFLVGSFIQRKETKEGSFASLWQLESSFCTPETGDQLSGSPLGGPGHSALLADIFACHS